MDSFGQVDRELGGYAACYEAMEGTRKKLKSLQMDEAEKERRMDSLKFQIDELERAQLKVGEEEALLQRRNLLRNSEKFMSAVQGAMWSLSGGDEGGGAAALLRDAGNALAGAKGLDEQFAQLHQRLEALYSECYDVAETLRDLESGFDFSPQELDELEGRADLIYRLKKKYGGSVEEMLEYLERVKVETPLPAYHMIPTHMNRNPLLFERGITYAKGGGYVDFTTSSYASFQEEGELKSSDGLKKMLDAGVPIEHITFSSDGQGSLPVFNREGENIDVQVARVDTLYQEVRDAVRQENIPLETALRTITSNVADHLRLSRKGRVREGNDADLVLADPDTLEIQTVIARGQIMLRDGELLVKGSFE